ncbi:MAG: PAS domain-containing protein [Eubacteriales bacterium]
MVSNDTFPKRDYSNKNERTAAMVQISGHPLSTFSKENDALAALIKRFKEEKTDELFAAIRDISIYYAKKGDLLYPLLKVTYGISGPSDLMWTTDDEIRDELNALAKKIEHDEKWIESADSLIVRIEKMIQQDRDVLFPICAVNFTNDEWIGIYHDSKDYDTCFNVKRELWETAENINKIVHNSQNTEIVMPGGHMNVEQITALLNTIPLEITFVDSDNINRFFNEGPKVFKRPGMAIDREVFSCHPPKIEPMVRAIINDFRTGAKDSVPIWMDKNGKTMLVTYMAVRDNNKKYLGTVEIVQDMEFAKEHFKK